MECYYSRLRGTMSESNPVAIEDIPHLNRVKEFILGVQRPDGAIPWFDGGKIDPWDHTEAAMGLTVLCQYSAARRAYEWLIEEQNNDGSWFAAYFPVAASVSEEEKNESNKIDTNFVAYFATGLWHYYLCTQDMPFVEKCFPALCRAIDYVIDNQYPDGDIQWALSATQNLNKDALVTASSSILRSLSCAASIVDALARHRAVESIAHGESLLLRAGRWRAAASRLHEALRNKPWRFDRTWESKARFSMDWFYPILAGVYTQQEAQLRLQKYWGKFVELELGCRCVSDEPWVTIAESSELVMALVAAGRAEQGLEIFKQLAQWQDSDGGYWTGYSYRDKVIWPREKTTWTAAAVVLAADALFELSPASKIFCEALQLNASTSPQEA